MFDRSILLLFCLVELISCHFQPNIQQVYQQAGQHIPQHQVPQQQIPPHVPQQASQHQMPIQNQYQYQQPVQQPGHVQQPGQVPQQGLHYQMPSNNILHDSSRMHDKEHLKEHLGNVMTEPDLDKMSEKELQFHYFKIHDSDLNNKLDGSELIKSLIHWHVEENKQLGANASPHGTTKIFTDEELAQMIDPILETDDQNQDGFIDYVEFLAAQKSRGF